MGKVLCWDLDETLGYFKFMDGDLPQGRRAGIERTLSSFNRRGFRNVVTTAGGRDYALTALGYAGLSKHFDEVFDSLDVSPFLGGGNGKEYGVVARQYSIRDTGADLLVIGNLPLDRPLDLSDVVFLLHNDAFLYRSSVVDRVVDSLLCAGKGSFSRGFRAMLAKNTSRLDGLALSLAYGGAKKSFPRIEVVSAVKYAAPTVPF